VLSATVGVVVRVGLGTTLFVAGEDGGEEAPGDPDPHPATAMPSITRPPRIVVRRRLVTLLRPTRGRESCRAGQVASVATSRAASSAATAETGRCRWRVSGAASTANTGSAQTTAHRTKAGE
jgi:hypothetical protein